MSGERRSEAAQEVEALTELAGIREDWAALYREMWAGLISADQKRARSHYEIIDKRFDDVFRHLEREGGGNWRDVYDV